MTIQSALKFSFLSLAAVLFIISCGEQPATKSEKAAEKPKTAPKTEQQFPDTTEVKMLTVENNQRSGEALFNKKCASCHTPGKKMIGPSLKNVRDRIPEGQWVYHWVRNSSQLIKSSDPYAISIFEEYNRTIHTAYPQLTEAEIDAILDYVDETDE